MLVLDKAHRSSIIVTETTGDTWQVTRHPNAYVDYYILDLVAARHYP